MWNAPDGGWGREEGREGVEKSYKNHISLPSSASQDWAMTKRKPHLWRRHGTEWER
jgi:hypothetical protein